MNIIILNGGMGAGKDTLQQRICEVLPDAVHIRFKNPLYKRMTEKFNLTMEQVEYICNDRTLKDSPSDLLGGKTPRQELIFISEEEFKKTAYGEDAVAVASVDEILETDEYGRKTFVYSDGGFDNEIGCLKRLLKIYGLRNVTLVRINKEGTGFVGDSRNYIPNPDIIIDNDVFESAEQIGDHMIAQFNQLYNPH